VRNDRRVIGDPPAPGTPRFDSSSLGSCIKPSCRAAAAFPQTYPVQGTAGRTGGEHGGTAAHAAEATGRAVAMVEGYRLSWNSLAVSVEDIASSLSVLDAALQELAGAGWLPRELRLGRKLTL
jgi:hypothetical protein